MRRLEYSKLAIYPIFLYNDLNSIYGSGGFQVKKPKRVISKYDYSVLTVLICMMLGCILVMIAIITSPQSSTVERVFVAIVMSAIALGAGTIFFGYLDYIKREYKSDEKDDSK